MIAVYEDSVSFSTVTMLFSLSLCVCLCVCVYVPECVYTSTYVCRYQHSLEESTKYPENGATCGCELPF